MPAFTRSLAAVLLAVGATVLVAPAAAEAATTSVPIVAANGADSGCRLKFDGPLATVVYGDYGAGPGGIGIDITYRLICPTDRGYSYRDTVSLELYESGVLGGGPFGVGGGPVTSHRIDLGGGSYWGTCTRALGPARATAKVTVTGPDGAIYSARSRTGWFNLPCRPS